MIKLLSRYFDIVKKQRSLHTWPSRCQIAVTETVYFQCFQILNFDSEMPKLERCASKEVAKLHPQIFHLNWHNRSRCEFCVLPVNRDTDDNVARKEESKDAKKRANSAEKVAGPPRNRRRPNHLQRHHQKGHLKTENVIRSNNTSDLIIFWYHTSWRRSPPS